MKQKKFSEITSSLAKLTQQQIQIHHTNSSITICSEIFSTLKSNEKTLDKNQQNVLSHIYKYLYANPYTIPFTFSALYALNCKPYSVPSHFLGDFTILILFQLFPRIVFILMEFHKVEKFPQNSNPGPIIA